MYSKKLKILIWIPLPPSTSWKGEGIAQTIENLLLSSENEKIEYTILVNKDHYYSIYDELMKKNNVKIVPCSLNWLLFRKLPKTKIKSDTANRLEYSMINLTYSNYLNMLMEKLKVKIYKYSNFFIFLKYAFLLRLFTLFQKVTIFRDVDIIWLPSPIIGWADKLKGKKIISFWDPFVFEYREFDKISLFLLRKYFSLFSNVSHIITQSKNNMDFLIDVFELNKNKISVIYNGSDIYSKYYKKYKYDNKYDVCKSWEKYLNKTSKKEDFIKSLYNEVKNHSELWRLCKKINDKTKIILISTQYRIYKGYETLLRVIEKIIENNSNIYFIFTGLIPGPLKRKYSHLIENIIQIIRVSRKQHVMLYLISDLVIHPSYVEGGLGCYPQFEAATLNRPTIVQRGRHTTELLEIYGEEIKKVECDFNNIDFSIKKIKQLLYDKSAIKENVLINKKCIISWKSAMMKYEKIFYKVAQNAQ